MKKSDKAMIVLVATLSALIAFFVAKAILGDVYNGSARVKTIDAYSTQIVQPDATIFNKDAINPAVQVQISGTD